jgi:hypothetical protein
MNKIKHYVFISLLVAIFFIGLVSVSHSFRFIFNNTSDEKIILLVWWWDHEFNYPGPVNVFGGEFEPKRVMVGSENQIGKKYQISISEINYSWRMEQDFEFEYDQDPGAIAITWDGCRARHKIQSGSK